MMKEIATFVSGAVAVATEPGVALAAIAGWFGHRWWARWREKRRFGGGEESDGRDVDTASEIDVNGRERLGAEELSPLRVGTEIVVPVLRGLEALVEDFKKQGLDCTVWVSWRGALPSGREWSDSFNPFTDFAAKRHPPSTVVTVDIELQVKRNRYPPKHAPLAWRGEFGGDTYRMVGTWRRGPRNILRAMLLDEPEPISAQNVTSLLELMEGDVNYAIASWETRETDGEESSRADEC